MIRKTRTSPRFIALVASTVAALLSAVAVGVLTRDFLAIVGIFVVVLCICYFVFLLLLKEFIYDKIKLIYRNIYRFKTQEKDSFGALDRNERDPIGMVSDEVLEWMEENRKEVDGLIKQENYRKEFLGNVSHELKTPIQNIQGYIHTLLDGALEDSTVNKLFLEKAAKSADRLEELVDDLTNISILGEGQYMDVRNMDMVRLTSEVLEIVESQAREKKIEIRFNVKNPKIVQVMADEAKIRQVLVNLLINAIKYGRSEGQVTISFYDMDKGYLTEITDNGDGIEEEHLPRLFERFYRTDKGRSRNQGGSGLGLAIVKHIIEAHKQTITVRSTKGVGSTFGFTLMKGGED